MLFQIALLVWVFLDESLDAWQVAGIVLAGLGTLVVQLRRNDPAPETGP
jgi:drug/metabolite transporter (DMT)-like permease